MRQGVSQNGDLLRFGTRVRSVAAGFTLLETMFALAIITVALAGIVVIQTNSLRTTAKARQLNIVAMLAKNAMIRAELDFTGKAFGEVKPEQSAHFEKPYEDYSWKREIIEVKFPELNVQSASGAGEGGGGGEASSDGQQEALFAKLFARFLSEAVRQVKITISRDPELGEKSYMIVTYWVDLNHAFALSPQ